MTYNIDHIVESIHNGQFEQAKEQLQKGCKTKPATQAFRMAGVMNSLSAAPTCTKAMRVMFAMQFYE